MVAPEEDVADGEPLEGSNDEDRAGAEDEEDAVQEHLKESVEATFRVKRLLSRGEAQLGGSSKKRRLLGEEESMRPIEQAKVKQLQQKWKLLEDPVVQHVLEGLPLNELQHLLAGNWAPDKFNMQKSPAEQVHKQAQMIRESSGPGSGALDAVSTFKYYWDLDRAKEQKLRTLSHKDLRYVLREFNGETPFEELLETAKEMPPEESANGAIPDNPGCSTMGRFLRLELIDPMANAVVFGDANLTFSVKLAKQRKALGHVGRVIATTFEQIGTLRERYKEIDETIKFLEDNHAEVLHGVDCTRIAVDHRFKGMEGSFGAVYYNFPHAGAVGGFFDGHPLVNWRHENLMRLFFRALRSFVKEGGIVKVSSNAGAVGVRYSYIIGSAIENEFVHTETVPFKEWHLHRYKRSYGDRRDVYKRPNEGEVYNVQRADQDMVYSFSYVPSGEPLPKQQIRRPPTLKTIMLCNDGPFRSLPHNSESRKRLANELYQRFVSECSGVHVG